MSAATFRLPWSLAMSKALAVALWPVFEPFVNGPPPDGCPDCAAAWPGLCRSLRETLARTFEPGELYPGRPFAVVLPVALELSGPPGRRAWSAWLDYTLQTERPNGCTNLAPDFAPVMLTLLEHPDVRALVKLCARPGCGRFFVRGRASRDVRRRSFCSVACRRAWQATPQGRADNRRRQAAHRRAQPRGRVRRA